MRYIFGFICVLVLVGGACGNCGGDEEGERCNVVGSESCSYLSYGQPLVCSEAGVWVETLPCREDYRCVANDGVALCVVDDCDDEREDFCTSLFSTECDGTVVQRCEEQGCPVWTDVEDCADSDLVCTVETRPASCVIPGACIDGTTRCSSDRNEVETCQSGDWNVTATCEQDQLCNDLGETAQCVDAACTEGETRCADNEVETCNALGLWTVTETCVQGCEVVNDEALCIVDGAPCAADKLFEQRCSPDDEVWIQECQNTGTQEAPVYVWVNVQDCSTQTPDYVCQQVSPGTTPYCFVPPG